MAKIVNRFNKEIILQNNNETILHLAEKNRTLLFYTDLSGANLSRADLSRADLSGADLSGANLYRANLSRADLSGADLSRANLSRADLYGAYLYGADLSRADLSRADLSGADLSGANLYRANLSGADLSRASLSGANLSGAKNVEFYLLPSLGTLSKIFLNNLTDNLQLELMRRDAQAHPYPELFDKWAITKKCPYQSEERYWLFNPNPELWSPGKPEMNDYELILAICKSQGWKIKNYLE